MMERQFDGYMVQIKYAKKRFFPTRVEANACAAWFERHGCHGCVAGFWYNQFHVMLFETIREF